ncbi:DUF1737 domain-containing protein [Flavobacterium terrae]|uniref:DUF1737 domain-containing protein n=1 Tax=Flavobacterium terrae TaxID=415425 RepID=A0A1M6F1W0_9FLAO|nr:DUF1737 domain-containing protein [Flavobacterium terrae]SHI91687.1 hypothetical protein SAMN05444363_2091 [Flavobacterium terrae]
MEYKIITATYESKLEEEIAALLKQGWKLQGGISICYNRGYGNTDLYFAQALIK